MKARAQLALLLIGLSVMASQTRAADTDPAASSDRVVNSDHAANSDRPANSDHAADASGTAKTDRPPNTDQAAANSHPTEYSAAALYNLANTYARAGKPAMAVVNYERAGLLAPNDPDIDANLRYVREAAHLPAESRTRLERAVTVLSPTVVSWLGVIGVFMIGASLLAGRLNSRHRVLHSPRRGLYSRYRALRFTTAVIGVALIGSTVGSALVLWPKVHEAVVLTAATPVRASPVPMGDQLFVLPEAETVRMTAEHEDFVLVHTKAGRSGWVSRANLAPVVPNTGAQ
jgi:hypothetical protein